MTQENTDRGALVGAIEDLAASRGYSLEGLAEEARRRGHAFAPEEIFGARGGFGHALDAVLELDESEQGRIVSAMADDMHERMSGDPRAFEMGPVEPRAPGLAWYDRGVPRSERVGDPRCCVSHPAAGGACGEPAVMEVWGLSFCGIHGGEAETSALAEMWDAARRDAEALLGAERPRWQKNAALLRLLRDAHDRAQREQEDRDAARERALELAYGDADSSHVHRDTLMFDPDEPCAGYPSSWWAETREAVCRLMREAHEDGLPSLLHGLEPMREWATVQEVLAVRHELNGFEMPA